MAASPAKFSVLLLDSHDFFGHVVATCLGQIPGIKLHVLSNKRWPTIRCSRFITSFHASLATNDGEQAEEIRRVSRAVRADVILPVTEFDRHFVIQNRALLTDTTRLTPLPSLELFEAVVNKYSLVQRLAQAGISSPATLLFTDLDAVKRSMDQLQFPVLLKPLMGSNGGGIQRFETPSELSAKLRDQPPVPRTHILQSYVPGRDVDCSVLCREGKILAHTIQFSARSRKNPFIVDDAIRFAPHDGAFALIERTMAALHWNDVAHLDMREDERDGRIYIVDFNPRYWATLLGSLTAGVNFPYLACLTALGIEFPVAGFQPINYLTTRAALRALARGRLSGNKTGLPYICNDPGPRLLNLAKRLRHFAIGQNTNHA